jgi:Flp pilus assembly protein TadG
VFADFSGEDYPVRRSPPSALHRTRRGAAAAELALLLPFLCFVFVLVVDFCRIFYCSLTVSNCARNGALCGALYASDPTNSPPYDSGIQAAAQAGAQKDATNLNLQQLGVNSSTDNGSSPTYVQVTVTYPFTTITTYPGIPQQTNLSRTVRMRVAPATPRFN